MEGTNAATEGVEPTAEDAHQREGVLLKENAPQTALERIPKDEKGEPKYEETDAKTAWDAIVEQTDGDEDMAEMIVDSMIGDKIKELDGLRKKGIMSGGTIAEKIAAEKKLRGEIEDAQRVLGHWQEIKKQKGWKEGVSDEGKGEVVNDEVTNANEGKKLIEGKSEGDAPKGGKMGEEKPKTEGEVVKGDERADEKENASKAAEAEEGKKVNGGNKENTAEEKKAEEKIAAEEKKSSEEKTSEGKTASEGKPAEEKKPIEGKGDGKEAKVDNGEASDSEEGVKNENGGSEVEEIAPIGKGVFGNIYDQFKGKVKEAFAFLKKIGGGEALAVLHHKDVGDIALVWGNEKAGAMKILRKHPEVVDNLQELLDGMHVVSSSDNRIVLESDTHKAVVSKKLGDKKTEQWLLTAYEKKNAAKGGSSDIGPKPQTEGGKQNGTAPLQDGSSSEGKGTKNGDGVQGGEGKKTSETSETDAEDVKKVTFKRLKNAVHVLANALKSGEGKEEAISELKRVVKESDKGEAAKNYLISYWQVDRYIKYDGGKVSKEHALILEVLGYLKDALTENGVGVNDGAKGVKGGDVVCYKKKEFKDAEGYYERVDRIASVDRSSVVMNDGTKVGKRMVLGYCRVGDEGLKGEKPTEKPTTDGGSKGDGLEEKSTAKKPTEKPTENTNGEDGAEEGSEKKPNGDGVSEPKVETASEGEKKPTEKKPKGEKSTVKEPTEKKPTEVKEPKENEPKEEKPKGESEEKIDDVGEKIAGARKDALRDMAKQMDDVTIESLIALPFGKAFKRPKLKDAVEKGVLRKRDARFADAVMCAFLSKAKPRLLSGWKARKSKMEIEAWAKEAYNGVKLLKMLMDGDEAKRDALIENVMGWKMYDEEEVKAKQRQYEEWNEGKKYEGECYPINPVKFFMDVFERLGYDSVDGLKLPFVGVRPDLTFDSYDLVRANGKKIYLRRNLTSYDDVVNEAVYLTRLMFADEDLDHPKDRFKLKGDDPIYETTGWLVNAVTVKGKKQSVNTHRFETKEEAEKFREEFKTKMGKDGYVSSAMEEKKHIDWGSFEIALHNDLTDAYVDTGLKFKTREEAEAAIESEHERLNEVVNGKLREALEAEAEGEKVGRKKDYVSVMQMFKDGKWKYAVVLDDKYAPRMKTAYNTMPYTLAEGFETKEEAEKYIEEHRGEIDARVEEVKKRRREFVYFNGRKGPRVGEDYRKGEDVTAEQFREQFGFRGVQFGIWTNQRDRQAAVNNAFDGFMDLARVLGVSPRALSLNGELGIAFGARGGGRASAHYELNEVVINLTKTKGAGSLAHEWWHALDNYFARRGNVKLGMVTENKGVKMRDELRDAFNALVDEVVKSDYDKRSTKEGDYWGSRSEETARLFETWVSDELMKRGESNGFLTSRDLDAEDKYARMNYTEYKWFAEFADKEAMSFEDYRKTASALNGFVYPTRGELDVLGLKVRKIFDTIQTRVDEATKNVVMYHRGRVVERVRSKAEMALLGAVIGIQKRMGLNVLTDVDEGQRVLDMVNGGAREHRVFHGSGADFEKFDHSHMGEGEGAQAFGWGTYVTEVEGIGRTYAEMGKDGKGTLYSVEIPDDTGENYFYLDRRVSSKDLGKIEEWVKGYLMKHEGYSERDAMQTVRDFHLGDATGYELVNTLRMEMPEKEVSKMLSEMGYVGSSFPSNWEVGFEVDLYGKKRDYVVFNEGDLAITEHVKFFRTKDGEAYGFTVGGRIYLDPRVATTETAVHEYAHLWAEALREVNREEWDNVVKLMKGTKAWDEVKRLYPELKGDDEVADEVVAMYSGRRGSERLREEMRKVMEGNGNLKERTAAVSALGRVKDALKKFWMGVADFLGIHFTTAEEVADKVMADMLSGVDPTKVKKSERVKKQIIGERGAERLDRDEMERGERMRNLEVAKEMAKEGRDAKGVKLATGWEMGKDGMWRYEVGDLRVKGNAKVDMERGRTRVVGRKVSEPIAKLGDLVDGRELFKAYPRLRDVDVVVDKSGKSGRRGAYSRLYGHIALNSGFFKEVYAPSVKNDEARARLEKLYDGLSEEEKIFADDGVDHFGGFTDEELARDVAFQRLEGNRPKVAAYIREALKVGKEEGGEVIGYRLNDDEQTCEVLTHEVQHAIQDMEGFEGGGNPKVGKHIARERNRLTEMQQKLVDDVKMYDEMMDDERSREKYPLSAFIRDNVRDGVYDEDFGKDLVGMSDEELRGEAERLMGMDGERLDGL